LARGTLARACECWRFLAPPAAARGAPPLGPFLELCLSYAVSDCSCVDCCGLWLGMVRWLQLQPSHSLYHVYVSFSLQSAVRPNAQRRATLGVRNSPKVRNQRCTDVTSQEQSHLGSMTAQSPYTSMDSPRPPLFIYCLLFIGEKRAVEAWADPEARRHAARVVHRSTFIQGFQGRIERR